MSLPGLVAERDGAPVGLLLYRIERDECEVVVLIAVARREGIGRALLEAVEPIARRAGCRRLWLVTTNDNRSALAFYRTVGWTQVAVHRGAVREASRTFRFEINRKDPDNMTGRIYQSWDDDDDGGHYRTRISGAVVMSPSEDVYVYTDGSVVSWNTSTGEELVCPNGGSVTMTLDR